MSKKMILATTAATIALAAALTGCSATQGQQSTVEQKVNAAQQGASAQENEPIKTSPDKYTWYIKDYRGTNAAAAGYTAVNELRYDRYGSGILRLVYVSADGTYIDPTDEETLKQYVVYDQNLKPNTEVKFEFSKKEDGTEYDNLVSVRSEEEIVLAVKKVGTADASAPCMTEIEASPDKYTRTLRDYVGRNLAECGYINMAGTIADQYGCGYLALNVIADDGSSIDLGNKESLSQYLVVGQSLQPNAAITMEFSKKDDGTEYENLVNNQNVKSIDLKVTKLDS